MKISAIYKLESKRTHKFYVGSSFDSAKRKREHFRQLKLKIHSNTILQNHVNKYGIDDLQFLLLEIIKNKETILEREQLYIDSLNPDFNIYRIAGSASGYKASKETREKLSKALKGKVKTPEHLRNIGLKHRGKKLSEEHRKKLSISHIGQGLGKVISEEQRKKISEAQKGIKRGPLSKEQKEKLSKMFSGKNNPFYGKTHTKEVRERISKNMKETRTGVKRGKMSEAQKLLISKTLTGRKLSEETIRKRTITWKANRAKKLLCAPETDLSQLINMP